MNTWTLASRELSYRITAYRRVWRASIMYTFIGPVLVLTSMGLGIGRLMSQDGVIPREVNYVTFIAAGVLAGTAMQVAMMESTYPVTGSLKWGRSYFAACATPLRPSDVYIGHLAYVIFRITTSCAFGLTVMAIFGAVRSWWALLALPSAVLTGLAFAAPMMAVAITVHEEWFHVFFRVLATPLYLFSGTFFPISKLPEWMQLLVQVTPLWHGVMLCRDLSLGTAELPDTVAHLGYLLVMTGAGIALGRHYFQRRLHA
jgi:lipooligosaccharide transport system permease protein